MVALVLLLQLQVLLLPVAGVGHHILTLLKLPEPLLLEEALLVMELLILVAALGQVPLLAEDLAL